MQQPKISISAIGIYLIDNKKAGVHEANRLTNNTLTQGVAVKEGGISTFYLPGYSEGSQTVVLMDATLEDNVTSSIRFMKCCFANDSLETLGTHRIALERHGEHLAING